MNMEEGERKVQHDEKEEKIEIEKAKIRVTLQDNATAAS